MLAPGDGEPDPPPHEHHQIHNPNPDFGISVHVYGHELKTCRRFVQQADGRYRADVVPLGYDEDLSVDGAQLSRSLRCKKSVLTPSAGPGPEADSTEKAAVPKRNGGFLC